MPHAIIEYSENIHEQIISNSITEIAHNTMIQSGLFGTDDIKTRAYKTTDFFVGSKGKNGSFVHVIIYLMHGRTTEKKQLLSEAMQQNIRAKLPLVNQISVDVRELDKDIYRKSSSA